MSSSSYPGLKQYTSTCCSTPLHYSLRAPFLEPREDHRSLRKYLAVYFQFTALHRGNVAKIMWLCMQNPLQYFKVIVFQLKKIITLKKKEKRLWLYATSHIMEELNARGTHWEGLQMAIAEVLLRKVSWEKSQQCIQKTSDFPVDFHWQFVEASQNLPSWIQG